MAGDEEFQPVRPLQHAPAVLADLDGLAVDGSCCAATQTQDELGFHQFDLALQPHIAGLDLADARVLVDAALAAHLVFEVLDGVGDVGRVAAEACLFQRAGEHLPGWTHERLAREVLLVAGLLAHDHQIGVLRPDACNPLCRAFPQIAAAAGLHLFPQRGDVGRGQVLVRDVRLVGRLLGEDVGVVIEAVHERSLLVACPLYQLRNQCGLGQVVPIFDRHFGLHGCDLQARRVEDVGVIGRPRGLHRVLARHVRLAPAGPEGEVRPVPHGGAVGRDDGPVHVGKTAGEERRAELQRIVRRLEPRHEPFAAVLALADFAEAHKGMHLVAVAPHRLVGLGDPAHVVIHRVTHERRAALQSPQQAVKAVIARGIGKAHDALGPVHELRARHHLAPRVRQGGLGKGQGLHGAVGRHEPQRVRRHGGRAEVPRLNAPRREVRVLVESDGVHEGVTCGAGGALRLQDATL